MVFKSVGLSAWSGAEDTLWLDTILDTLAKELPESSAVAGASFLENIAYFEKVTALVEEEELSFFRFLSKQK